MRRPLLSFVKPTLKYVTQTLVRISAIMLFASSVQAGVIYNYTGEYFHNFTDPSSYDNTNRVTLSMSFDELLPANFGPSNGAWFSLDEVSGFAGFALTMSDGEQTLTFGDLGVNLGDSGVTTDTDGNITFWDINLNSDNAGISTIHAQAAAACFSRGNGYQSGNDFNQGRYHEQISGNCSGLAPQGSWQIVSTQVPEPSSLLLLSLAIIGLRVSRPHDSK